MLSASDNAYRMYSLFETGDVEFGIDAQKLLADIDIVKSGLIKRTALITGPRNEVIHAGKILQR
ncbi:hypothetical protein I6H07_22585 (plasmid) [Hafnia alvei]|uniref:hypothetical protein n=1 Tax=Hafnia alvei TaxID=569 RepID=UPI000B6BA289|nr:hypothetical protein [Hafnia alvei]MBI0278530.1 hypothetical protein [Hafnia alvei]PNL03952.1 hypothetical protein CEQ28_000755 [Hafnia alvei]